MSLEDNKTIARRFFEECLIQGNMDVFDTSFAPHLAVHHYGTPALSHTSYRPLALQLHQAFSGHSLTIDDLIAEGDKVAIRLSYTAKAHHSHFGKNHPTGRPVQAEATLFFHFAQGKVVEMWGLYQGIDFDLSPA